MGSQRYGERTPVTDNNIFNNYNLGKNLKVPVYELLGGKVRNEVQVYCWIGGDRPSDVEAAAYVPRAHEFMDYLELTEL